MSSRTQPAVTIGMPVYNGANLIEDALSALREQTCSDYTVLVSDNASTDGTAEILQKWAAEDDRIVVHRQKDNIGAIRNFRYVLDRAESEYFMWYACDDWLAPNYLEELIGVMKAEPSCALACGTTLHVSGDGNPIRQISFPAVDPGSRVGRIRQLLKGPESAWIYGLFRTATLRRTQAISQTFGYVWANDFVTLLRFMLNDQIQGTDRTTFYYRVSDTSKDAYAPKMLYQRLGYLLRYLWFHVRLFGESELSPIEKLWCWPWLLAHYFKTTEAMIKRPIKRAIKTPVKNLSKIVTGSADQRNR